MESMQVYILFPCSFFSLTTNQSIFYLQRFYKESYFLIYEYSNYFILILFPGYLSKIYELFLFLFYVIYVLMCSSFSYFNCFILIYLYIYIFIIVFVL